MNEHALLETSSWASKEVQAELPGMTEFAENPRAAALILGVCTYFDDTPVRNEAKKIVKKHGTPEMKAVLTVLSKRNYDKDSAKKLMLEDMVEVEAISPPLATHLYRVYMEKALSMSDTRLRYSLAAKFYEHATDAEIKNAISLGKADRTGSIVIAPAGRLPARGLPLLWEALEEQADVISRIEYDTEAHHELDIRATMPLVHTLAVRGGLSQVSESIRNMPRLAKLELRDVPKLDTLPEFLTELPNLQFLQIFRSGLLRIPGSLGKCPKLTELVFFGGPLAEIEAGLADSKTLKSLNVADVTGVRVAPEVMNMPNLSKDWRRKLKDVSADQNSYEPAFDNLEFLLTLTKESPSAKEAVQIWKKTKDPAKAHLPELLIALSRCAHDEEHGPSSNTYFREVLEARAPLPLREISKLVPTRITSGPSKELTAKLQAVPGFNVARFATFTTELLGA